MMYPALSLINLLFEILSISDPGGRARKLDSGLARQIARHSLHDSRRRPPDHVAHHGADPPRNSSARRAGHVAHHRAGRIAGDPKVTRVGVDRDALNWNHRHLAHVCAMRRTAGSRSARPKSRRLETYDDRYSTKTAVDSCDGVGHRTRAGELHRPAGQPAGSADSPDTAGNTGSAADHCTNTGSTADCCANPSAAADRRVAHQPAPEADETVCAADLSSGQPGRSTGRRSRRASGNKCRDRRSFQAYRHPQERHQSGVGRGRRSGPMPASAVRNPTGCTRKSSRPAI